MTFTSCLRSRWMDGWKAGKSHSRNLVILSFQLQKYQLGHKSKLATHCLSLPPYTSFVAIPPSLPCLIDTKYKEQKTTQSGMRQGKELFETHLKMGRLSWLGIASCFCCNQHAYKWAFQGIANQEITAAVLPSS